MHPGMPIAMAERGGHLNSAERLALAMSHGAVPTTWRHVVPARGTAPASMHRRRGMAAALAAISIAVTGVLGLELFTIRPGQPGAILFPSGTSEATAFTEIVAAGGLPIRATRAVFGDATVWLAAAADPSFFSKVVSGNAIMVINPLAFGGCLLVQP